VKRILVSWSSGKDSAWMLAQLQRSPEYEIAGLLTSFNSQNNRVAMHAVRHELVELQAKSAGLSLWSVPLPVPCSNDDYERLMGETFREAVEKGIGAVAFGDLFLKDIRDYRERQFTDFPLQPVFPIWCAAENTAQLATSMVASGMKAIVTCVDPRQLPPEFLGREYDDAFVNDLPSSVDPCGENGEFHTFCYAGPHLQQPISVSRGETVERDGFHFMDLLPA